MMWQCGVAALTVNPMIGPPPDALSTWGAKNSALILNENEYYRLFTPLLLHAGILHLVGNIGVQLETGVFFEREWGTMTWLLIYLASGVGSTILSVCLIPNALSVGSSGAVMGLFGGKLAEIVCRACERRTTVQQKAGHEMRKHQLVLCVGGVVLVMAFSFIPFVDWAAHLGGLLAGFTVGLMVFAFSIETMVWRIVWFLFGVSGTIAGFVVSLKYMYTEVEPLEILEDVCAYYQEYYQDYECACARGG
jgi:membrane associated rhomboid family serine protease